MRLPFTWGTYTFDRCRVPRQDVRLYRALNNYFSIQYKTRVFWIARRAKL